MIFSPSKSGVPLTKGSAFVGFADAFEQTFDKETLERVLLQVTPELADEYNGGRIMAAGWYPLEWFKSLHQASQQVTGRDEQLAWELTQILVTSQLQGIYKALLKVISPHWLFNFPSLLFSRYFSTGTLKVPESRAGHVRGLWSGCTGFDLSMWNSNCGGSQAALESAGAQDVRIEVIAGGRNGFDSAEVVGSWR
jgi:hypothetical protein